MSNVPQDLDLRESSNHNVLTIAAFYDVPPAFSETAMQLRQQQLVPVLHANLTSLSAFNAAPREPSSLDLGPRAGNQPVLGLLTHGKTDEQIGEARARSDDT